MTLRPSTRTFGTVKRAVRRTFGDEAGVQLDDLDIIQWTDDAQQAILTKNKALKAVSTSQSVVGQGQYDFPTPLIQQVESILYDGRPLDPMDISTAQATIQKNDPKQSVEGVPYTWFEWAGQFTLYPTPNEVKDITLYYTRYATPITGVESQLLDVPDKYYQAVVDYILWKAYELDEDWQGAQMKENHFRGALEEQAEEERESSHMLYPTVTEVGW